MTIDRHWLYFDNAATTAIDPAVIDAMLPYLYTHYGNPATPYRLGTKAHVAIEQARREILEIIGGEGGNLFFTSGGTESNNWALRGLVAAHKIGHLITSPLEHMSVIESARQLAAEGAVKLHWVEVDQQGAISYSHLTLLLSQHAPALVSLMHGNNELGNVTDISKVGGLCRRYGALFHTDVAQTVSYLPLQLAEWPIDACSATAHKFHGPKGIGFLYLREGVAISPYLRGGAQEKGMRAGTPNVANIVGMRHALRIAAADRGTLVITMQRYKTTLIQWLQKEVPGIVFHGLCADKTESLPNIINVGLPFHDPHQTLMMQLEVEGVTASAGSACTSGATGFSHVLHPLGIDPQQAVLRLSLSKYTDPTDLPLLAKKIATIVGRY